MVLHDAIKFNTNIMNKLIKITIMYKYILATITDYTVHLCNPL